MNNKDFRRICSNRPITQSRPNAFRESEKDKEKSNYKKIFTDKSTENLKDKKNAAENPTSKECIDEKDEKDKNDDRVLGSIILLCIVLCATFIFTIRASNLIDKDFSENEGIGAAVKALKEMILQNDDISAFLGLTGITDDNDNNENVTDDTDKGEDSKSSASNEAVAAAVQKYIEEHNTVETSKDNSIGIFPLDGIITSLFSTRENPFYQVGAGEDMYEFHSGIDISAAKSTNISAYDDGIVSLVSYSASYGNFLVITHREGFETLYAHCSKIIVKNGQKVSEGELIAIAGSTGRSTAKHLHFEVRIDGKAVNPLSYLPKADQDAG